MVITRIESGKSQAEGLPQTNVEAYIYLSLYISATGSNVCCTEFLGRLLLLQCSQYSSWPWSGNRQVRFLFLFIEI